MIPCERKLWKFMKRAKAGTKITFFQGPWLQETKSK